MSVSDAQAVETDDPDSQSEGSAKHGSKQRSGTAYPYFGLEVALSLVEAIRRAGGNDAAYQPVMAEMGVKKATDRAWTYGVPAATQFGLISRDGRGNEGRLRLTEQATRIVLPTSDAEKKAALVAAFKTPELYSKLLVRFAGHPVPSKEGLKNLLQREFQIVESMAPIAADAFLDSLAFAGLVNEKSLVGEPIGAATTKELEREPPAKPEVPEGMQTLSVPADFIIYKCKIGKGRVIEIALPRTFTKSELGRLTAFLATQVDDEDQMDTSTT